MCQQKRARCVCVQPHSCRACVSVRDNNCYITFILTSWATSNLLNVCSFCICAAVGGKDDVVKKEDAQKDQINWPWKKVGALQPTVCVRSNRNAHLVPTRDFSAMEIRTW